MKNDRSIHPWRLLAAMAVLAVMLPLPALCDEVGDGTTDDGERSAFSSPAQAERAEHAGV